MGIKRIYSSCWCIAVGMSLFLSSCTAYNKAVKSGDRHLMYETAKQEFVRGRYASAATLLQETVTGFKGTSKGEESLYLLGMSHFYAKDYINASAVLTKFFETYPKSNLTEEARYNAAYALYLNAPEPKLDQTDTYAAISAFYNFMELYPNSSRMDDVRALIFKLQDRLVEKEYYSAKLYYDLGRYFGNCTYGGNNYQACIVTAENALKEYPYSTLRESFSFLILQAKAELAFNSVLVKQEDRVHSALDEYYSFSNEFPESKFSKEAKTLFVKLSRYSKEAPSDVEPSIIEKK